MLAKVYQEPPEEPRRNKDAGGAPFLLGMALNINPFASPASANHATAKLGSFLLDETIMFA
ncbi:MAG: hypothetical protein H7144_13620 [Burkholderiales bacterium]|nr:hypothetical protein [Phycisphaerae bacterium]